MTGTGKEGNYAACFVQSESLSLLEIQDALGVEADYSTSAGMSGRSRRVGITHLHRRSMWELQEPIPTPDATQGAIDRILQRWPSVAKQVTTLGEQVVVSSLDVKLVIDSDLENACRFRLTRDQLNVLGESTGFNISLFDRRDDPETPVTTPSRDGTKRAGLVAADGGWVLQHAALPECDTWTLVNIAMLGCSRWFVWDAGRLRAQRPTAFVVRLPLHHDAHWDTGFSLDAEEIRLLVDLDITFDVEIWTLP